MRGTVDLDVSGTMACVRVAGDVDLIVEPRLRALVMDALDRGCLLVVLDLSQVSFIDCAGVAALLAVSEDVKLAGGALQVHEASKHVTRMLALTGTEARLPQPA